MLIIGTKAECSKITHLPIEVQQEVEDTIDILNQYYGEHRNIDRDMGGYVLLLENPSDQERLENIFHQAVDGLIPEYVDKIITSDGIYTKSLIICSSDYSITIVAKINDTPKNLLEHMEKGCQFDR